MVHAKNYETASTFVKVIPRKLLASFFPDTCALQVPLASGNDDGITVNSVADTVAEARCGVGLCYLLLSPSCQPSCPSVCLSRTHQAPDI